MGPPAADRARGAMLAALIDVRRWLQADRDTPYENRLERDRAIGRTLAVEAGSHDAARARRVLGWWRAVRRDATADDGGADLGHRVETLRRLVSVLLGTVGLLVGASVAGVAFAYDGRHPVNLFTLLGVLVGLPLLLLALTLLMLPGRLPGLGGLRSALAGMNLGRWAGAWLDRYVGAPLFAPSLLAPMGASAFSRWQLVVFSQWMAIGFFVGALLVAFGLVAFTDLAFGWSTTLDFGAADLEPWVAALAAPWAAWLPSAAPDLALLEASRYFRGEGGGMPQARAAALGSWWPFVLMTILVYGLLPRVLLMLVARWRLRRATRALLLDDPEVTALLDRLDAPVVALGRAIDAEASDGDATRLPAPQALEGSAMVVVWNRAAAPDAAASWVQAQLGVGVAGVVELGILDSAAERRSTLERLPAKLARLIVLTKGWEPPLLEFADFVGELRERVGPACSITLVPLDVSRAAVRAAERDVWARALSRVRDARLYVLEATA